MNTKKMLRILPLILALMAWNTSCDSPPEERAVYRVQKHAPTPPLTGRADDPAWQAAEALTDFRFPWQERPAPATAFRALWNEEFLSFQFVVHDDDIVLGEGETQEQAVLGSDRVELFFAADPDLQHYYTLEMDPRAWVFDAHGSQYRKIDSAWDWPGLELAASLTDDGYILEGRIPMASFAELDLWQDGERRRLRCGVFRAEFGHEAGGSVRQNWISWIMPDSPKPDFHIPSAFGQWELVD